ncbi:MAG: hypothetical protein HC886_19360 [Leptolyngbyaceae cyanobacterium SM1_1_3]|nr:hypothetical protein [Leptolyngbyaceae cyanobacterium SM1_1_3]NJM84937.1 hypothetical protein [Leptolyngbyaceae cyanobacterium RM2_2_21]NJN04940.1 hypothetical protein [Leptolyngbyaceae cyanobacterium RM1_1_2]NJO11357.1 hypothetical protein [Leptolyngbyaceae cyanobacterium SL_1_1]
MTILEANRIYLFSQFAEFGQPPHEILAELGYQLTVQSLTLPRQPVLDLSELQHSLERRIQLTPLTSEQARREALVSPVLFSVVEPLNLRLNIEYPVSGKRSKGTLDYLIRGENTLRVVEAKRDDLTRGFTQLAVEMTELGNCYGGVTTGNIWQFAQLNNTQITQDINLYRVPADLTDLMSILTGILTPALLVQGAKPEVKI